MILISWNARTAARRVEDVGSSRLLDPDVSSACVSIRELVIRVNECIPSTRRRRADLSVSGLNSYASLRTSPSLLCGL